jgi:molybdate-binding protein/DNA-binding XRE family transcriptional regulator
MPAQDDLINVVREHRIRRHWSQDELARRAGLSRAGVSAIEVGRLVPSTAAALALAEALSVRVDVLFRLARGAGAVAAPRWAWEPVRKPCRYWAAEVGGQVWRYPAEASPLGTVPHDGVVPAGDPGANAAELPAFDGIETESRIGDASEGGPSRSLVLACCDPAVGLLAGPLSRLAGVRLIVLPRSSRSALELLGRGLVHVAGVHLSGPGIDSEAGGGNAQAVLGLLGGGYRLLRLARWEEGIASLPALRLGSVASALAPGRRWVGREPGSGARQCLDALLGDRPSPEHSARDHRGVAEAIRSGWADLGVCLRLAGEEAGLDFFPLRLEAYDLCYPAQFEDDPRLVALREVVRSTSFRRTLGGLPGYQAADTGEARFVEAGA